MTDDPRPFLATIEWRIFFTSFMLWEVSTSPQDRYGYQGLYAEGQYSYAESYLLSYKTPIQPSCLNVFQTDLSPACGSEKLSVHSVRVKS